MSSQSQKNASQSAAWARWMVAASKQEEAEARERRSAWNGQKADPAASDAANNARRASQAAMREWMAA